MADTTSDHALHVEFDPMPLAIIETDRLDVVEALKRPGETRGRILPSRKKHKSRRCGNGRHRLVLVEVMFGDASMAQAAERASCVEAATQATIKTTVTVHEMCAAA